MTPIVAKVSPQEKERFFEATEQIGTTPSNAIRMFIAAFNREGYLSLRDKGARGE